MPTEMHFDVRDFAKTFIHLDPFQDVNPQGVHYAQTPCFSVLRMPVPTCIETSLRHAIAILATAQVRMTLDGRAFSPQEAAVHAMLGNAIGYLLADYNR